MMCAQITIPSLAFLYSVVFGICTHNTQYIFQACRAGIHTLQLAMWDLTPLTTRLRGQPLPESR